eukprot:COSAG03_NODE_940_length_5258_cov_1.998255_1_plen_793_part_00
MGSAGLRMAEFRAWRAPPVSLQNSAATCGVAAEAVAMLCDAPAAGGVGICAHSVPDGAEMLELRADEATGAPDAQAWSADGGTLALGIGRELCVYTVSYGSAGRAGLRLIWRAVLHFHCKAVAIVYDSRGATTVAVGGADGVLLFCGPSEDRGTAAPAPTPEPEPESQPAQTACVAASLALLHHEPVCCLAFAEPGMVTGETLELSVGTVDGRLVVCTVGLGTQRSGPPKAHTLVWPLGEEGGGGLRRVTALSYRPAATSARNPAGKATDSDGSPASSAVLAVACWDGSVHLLSAHSFARSAARNAATAAEERVDSHPQSRWVYSTPRLIRDVQAAGAGVSGGDSAAMGNGAALLCWSPDGSVLVLALGGELHLLSDGQYADRETEGDRRRQRETEGDAQTGSASGQAEPTREWGSQCTPRNWRLLKPAHGNGDQKLQVKGLTGAGNCLVVVSRMTADRATPAAGSVHVPSTEIRSSSSGGGSGGRSSWLASVAENRSMASDAHTNHLSTAAAVPAVTREQVSTSVCYIEQVSTSVCCIEWSSIVHRHTNAENGAAASSSPATAGYFEFAAGSVTVVAGTDADEEHSDQQHHCPTISVKWSDKKSESAQHRIRLEFAPRGVHLLPYICVAERRVPDEKQEEKREETEARNQGVQLQAVPLVARLLLGAWGLAVLFDSSVYVWLRTQGEVGSWRLVVTPSGARAVCVGVGRTPQLDPAAAADSMQADERDGRWWWLAVEDDQDAVATLPLVRVSDASRCRSVDSTADVGAGEEGSAGVDGALQLWERVRPGLR